MNSNNIRLVNELLELSLNLQAEAHEMGINDNFGKDYWMTLGRAHGIIDAIKKLNQEALK